METEPSRLSGLVFTTAVHTLYVTDPSLVGAVSIGLTIVAIVLLIFGFPKYHTAMMNLAR